MSFNHKTINQMIFESSSALGILKSVVFENFIFKIAFSVGAYVVYSVRLPNESRFLVMFLVYALDFVTGVRKALSIRNFSSGRFFRGAVKLGVYGILVIVAHSLDFALNIGSVFTVCMFVFIITTESSSVIENLHDLGFNTPAPLQRFLKSYSTKIRRDKIAQFDPDSAVKNEDYSADFAEMISVYIPKIKDKQLQKLLKIKLENWGVLVNRVQNMDIVDQDVFSMKLNLLLKETVKDIETAWAKEGVSNDTIESFEVLHKTRKERFFENVQKIIQSDSAEFEIKRLAILKELSLINYQALTESLNSEFTSSINNQGHSQQSQQ